MRDYVNRCYNILSEELGAKIQLRHLRTWLRAKLAHVISTLVLLKFETVYKVFGRF